MPAPVITLTTDFGLTDTYVGVMKGVIFDIAPDARIVDLSHGVPPQDVSAGAYLIHTAYRYFAGGIHVVVVDPGVGTDRRPIAVACQSGVFIGPDNGVLYPALREAGAVDAEGRLTSGTGSRLENPNFRRQPVSQTFHGRDIFAPAAAHISRGVDLADLGPTITDVQVGGISGPVRRGAIRGQVVWVDHFGNCITNISSETLPERPVVRVGDLTLRGLASSYQEADVLALIGSSGLLEIAARNASASSRYGIRSGDEVIVRGER